MLILEAVQLICEAEGFRGVEYLCPAGKRTIGYGRNLESNPLSEAEIKECFKTPDNKLSVSEVVAKIWVTREAEKIIKRCESESWFKYIGVWRQAVVVDVIYNIGFKKWQGFKKCQKALEDKNFGIASLELMDSKWYHQVGNRAKRNVEIMKFGEPISWFN